MTSKLTRGQLHERARENVKALKMASRQHAFESAREEILADLQLAELALAVMDSEPVAYIDKQWTLVYYIPPMSMGLKIGDKLYRHAQPAPVVPNGLRLALSNAGIAAPESDEMLAATCEKHIQALVTWVKDRKPFQSAPVVPSFEEWLSAANRKPLGWVKDAMREAYDACRAAMLQAGNSPVIPDGYRLQPISEYEAMCATVNSDEWPQRWIPVSERMPEDRTQVILWDAEIGEVTSGHYSHKTHTFYHCGDAIQNEITHWMPLPAAPQEVSNEK
ncbi:DUF551 domain-containing protein [Raoultella planticola]|uniref:DUF551 domain-containing protein n=1 Tax=Raoultella planticola TaxID=575 RepID=UPI0025AA60A9|nr:DUF551 domain-containing protein [Raoultella planticola]MDM9666613.1 DUF551 domain-containing protein [Raoultella planticola]